MVEKLESNSMKKKSIGLNAFLNSLRNILNIIFPLITFPYVSRVLQVNGIGKYNFSQSVVSYFVLIAGLGITPYAIREGARYRDKKKKIEKFGSEIFSINMLSTVFSYFLLFTCLLIFYNLRNYILCILIFSLQLLFSTLGIGWIYSIYEDYAYITLRSVLFQIVSIILLFIFVRNDDDYLKYAAITVFSSVGSNLLNFIHAKRYCTIKFTLNINWHRHLKPILLIFASMVAATIYINSDITLLGILKNDFVVGLYSVSSKVYSIITTLLTSIYIVAVPRLSMYLGKKKIQDYELLLSNVTNNLIMLIFPAVTGLFMLSKNVILIISSKSYLQGTTSLQILCFALIFAMLAGDLYECVLIPSRREKYILISTISSSIINLVLNLLLIPLWGQNAAAVTTIIAEATEFMIDGYFAKDIILDVFTSHRLRINMLQSIIGCLGIVLICILCSWSYQNIILQTLLSIVLSVIMYSAILILFKNEIAIMLIQRFKYMLKNKL